ncbi:MAG TPA: S53 family peptidase [Acidobacteriaceae bacterium]|nr:S53 family peptidase [Acidobacteriaceae bacterium]
MQPYSSTSPRVSLPFTDRKLPAAAGVVGAMPPDEEMRVSVIVKRKQPLDLADLQGRHLSRTEFANKYAASPEAFDQLRSFAEQHGLSVDEGASSLERRTLVLTGTAAQMQQAFGVELQQVEHDGRHYRIHQQPVTMPQECAAMVDAVLGLDTRPQAKSHLRKLKDLRPAAAVAQSYLPRQVAEIYGFPTDVDGNGETIGILELGGGFTTTDIQQYFQNQNITPPQVVAVSVDGGTNSPTNPSGADSEVMLDIEVAASVAPAAKIAVYFTPNTDQGFIDALTTAIHDTTNHPSVISISWGGPESSWTRQAMTALDDACQSAAALGVSITAACGDSGSTDGLSDGANHVDFPASSPHVLACGGTKITASGTKLTSEVVWNDEAQNGGATGGGVSTVFALPSWQQNANVSGATNGGNGRGVPDVAGDAAPETGYSIEVDGQTEVVGGTSAVAPLWGGLIALLNQKLGKPVGFLNPQIYPLLGSAAFRDITRGTNGTYKAGVGWDACTGLGSPVGTTLATKL